MPLAQPHKYQSAASSDPPQSCTTSLYVHFPWCERKCPYCDFSTRAIRRNDLPLDRYVSAVCSEIAWRANSIPNPQWKSVFFGGGTPSLMRENDFRRILEAASRVAPLPSEITAECNPNSLDQEKIDALYASGITRLSIGVQSLRDPHLRYLERLHDGEKAKRALEGACKKFQHVSSDLMYGMPDQTAREVTEDVRVLRDLGASHISAYALTIEERTRFGKLYQLGKLPISEDDDYRRMYDALVEETAEAGWDHYEVSNFARSIEERSIHNAFYWSYGQYIGVGPAAVGSLWNPNKVRIRYTNDTDAHQYMLRVKTRSFQHLATEEQLSLETILREKLMLGLRTSEGVRVKDFMQQPLFQKKINQHLERGNFLLDEERITIPRDKWFLMDSIILDFF